MSKHVPDEVWEAQDWSLPDDTLAEPLGVTPYAVKLRRRRHAPETRKRHRCGWRVAWSELDWSKSNIELASQLGCLADTVRRKRLELQRL